MKQTPRARSSRTSFTMFVSCSSDPKPTACGRSASTRSSPREQSREQLPHGAGDEIAVAQEVFFVVEREHAALRAIAPRCIRSHPGDHLGHPTNDLSPYSGGVGVERCKHPREAARKLAFVIARQKDGELGEAGRI